MQSRESIANHAPVTIMLVIPDRSQAISTSRDMLACTTGSFTARHSKTASGMTNWYIEAQNGLVPHGLLIPHP